MRTTRFGNSRCSAWDTNWTTAEPELNLRQKLEWSTRSALGPNCLPTQQVPRTLHAKIKRPGRKFLSTSPSIAEVKNMWIIPPYALKGVIVI